MKKYKNVYSPKLETENLMEKTVKTIAWWMVAILLWIPVLYMVFKAVIESI